MTQDAILLTYTSISEAYRNASPDDTIAVATYKATLDYLHQVYSKFNEHCPFCNAKMVYLDLYWYSSPFERGVITTRCNKCGWWYTLDSICDDYVSYVFYPSVLVPYSAQDPNLPIDLILSELQSKEHLLYQVGATVFERIVAQIMRHVYDCDVMHVGRTGDGGIDLVILDCDNPVAVQVKRRTKTGKIETVNIIREFIGAMVIGNYRKGMFVTTADHFSRGSINTSHQAEKTIAVDRLNLVDIHRLIDFYNLSMVPKEYRPWRNLECYTEFRRKQAGLPHACIHTDDPKSCA